MIIKHRRGQMPQNLNFGCGSDIKDNHVNLDTHIADIDIEIAKSKTSQCWIVEGDLLSPHGLPQNHFTLVWAEMVFEHVHIDQIPSVLYSLSSIMQADGVLVITVPNFDQIARDYADNDDTSIHTVENLAFLREITFQLLDPDMSPHGPSRGHQSLWTESLARMWLNGEGFVIDRIGYENSRWVMKISARKVTQYTAAIMEATWEEKSPSS